MLHYGFLEAVVAQDPQEAILEVFRDRLCTGLTMYPRFVAG